MNINEMLNDSSFLVGFEATSKKHILNALCKLANKNFNVAFIESVENKISDKTKETKYYQMLANSKYNENPKKQTYIMLRKEDVKL